MAISSVFCEAKLCTVLPYGAGSSEESFSPTIFDVTVNSDLGLTINSVIQLGTPMPASSYTSLRTNLNDPGPWLGYDSTEVLGNYDASIKVMFSRTDWYKTQQLNSFYANTSGTHFNPSFKEDVLLSSPAGYLGAYYQNDVSYLLFAIYMDNELVSTSWAAFPEKKPPFLTGVAGDSAYDRYAKGLHKQIIKWFYPSEFESKYTSGIVMFSPENKVFQKDQSSVLRFGLYIEGDLVSENPDVITVSTGTGWGYDDESMILHYVTGNNRSIATVTFIYNDVEYKANFIFYPAGWTDYTPGGNSGPGGGDGTFLPGGIGGIDDTTSLIPNGTSHPNVASTGLFTMYAVDAGGLQQLGAALYAETILQNIGKEIMSFLWNSPIEGVISLTMFPFGVSGGGARAVSDAISPISSGSIKLGSLELPISLSPLSSSSMSINWGGVSINETWGNFLDYPPHTQIELYLPYGTGFVQINPHDVMGGSISVTTNVDLVKGSCLHIVSGKYGVIGTYSGQAGFSIPVTSIDTSGKGIAMVGAAVAAASAIGSAAGGVIAGARGASSAQNIVGSSEAARRYLTPAEQAASAKRMGEHIGKGFSKPYESISQRHASIAGASALAAFRTPPSIPRSGSFSSSSGGLGPTAPFVIVSVPEQNVPADYGHYFGYPCNISSYLGILTGYTEVGDVHLNGIICTEPELAEIDSLLKGGVFF